MLGAIRKKLQAEVEALNYELRVTLPQTLKKALALGDLRENGDYHAAIERFEVRGHNRVLAPVIIELIYPEKPPPVRPAMYSAAPGGWLPATSKKRGHGPTQRLLARSR